MQTFYFSFYFYLWFTFNLGRKGILASGTLWPRDINRGGNTPNSHSFLIINSRSQSSSKCIFKKSTRNIVRVFVFKNCWIKERKDLCLTRRRVGKIEFRQYNIIKYIISHYNLKRGKNLCSARRRADKYEFMVSMLLL